MDHAAIVRPVDAAPGNMVEGDLLDLFETEDANAEVLSPGEFGCCDEVFVVLWSCCRLQMSITL